MGDGGEEGGGSNDMKGHYFTKLVTEQRRLGGRSWPRKDNLVVRGAAPEYFELYAFQHLESEFLARKAGDKEWGWRS